MNKNEMMIVKVILVMMKKMYNYVVIVLHYIIEHL